MNRDVQPSGMLNDCCRPHLGQHVNTAALHFVQESAFELQELAGPAVDAAYDVSGRRMATCVASSSGSIIQVVHGGI